MGAPNVSPESHSLEAAAAEIDSIFSQAIAFHRAGLLPEAERLYQRILRAYPPHFDSLHLLGVISYQRGEYAEAVRQIGHALEINPTVADAHNNLGNALKRLGQFREALASYDKAIALNPDDAAGDTFASRVAGSLLNAVGLPELITCSLADYEALALELARDPAILASVRQKLARHRDTFPLFDTERFTRHIEAAYTTMWERYQRGEPAEGFAVARATK